MEMDILTDRIHQCLRFYTDQLKFTEMNTSTMSVSSTNFQDEFRLSSDGKKKQLIDQVISEAIGQITMCVRESPARKIAEDIAHDIFSEDGGRKLYAPLV
jgi:hypothetical protein